MAVEFSLRDIVTSLENGDSGAYIKDIITNKMWSFLFFIFLNIDVTKESQRSNIYLLITETKIMWAITVEYCE
jgi:hypothetical protein